MAPGIPLGSTRTTRNQQAGGAPWSPYCSLMVMVVMASPGVLAV